MALAREAAQLVVSLKRAPQKVLALDLDNTLWGGVVADDRLDGIQLGDTVPRGEACKVFPKSRRSSRTWRGIWNRVLKRQVEEEVLNEVARLAKARGYTRLFAPRPKMKLYVILIPGWGLI